MLQRVKLFSLPNGVETGLTVIASDADAARKPEGRDAFRAREASSARSEAEAYRIEYSTCMVKVKVLPTAPAGGSYSSERICETPNVSAKSILPEPISSVSP